MIVSPAFAGKRYAVLGLARSGAATVRALLASGAEVCAWDADEARRAAIGAGATLADPLAIDLAGFDGVVVSPGVPLNSHPIAAAAARAGVPVIGDIELFAQARPSLPPHRVVGITGTNGKSTVTALIHHMLETAGVPTTLGGNIGMPILGQEPLPESGVYVLELSSFQIDLTFTLDCDVAVLTNITPDHLDRYDGFEAYAASKARLFAMQGAGHAAVIVGEDEASASINARHPSASWDLVRRARVRQQGDPGFRWGDELGQGSWPSLQGPHNVQNAVAAIAAAEALGLADGAIADGLRTYPGLPHRMERVGSVNFVNFVNDSKATNATSAAPALGAFPRIHWILGGRRKTDELDACRPYLGNVVAAWTIGEAGALFADLLAREGVSATNAGTLDAAVRQAAAAARPGDTVLLSPACASYDQFPDYEARGRAFVQAVHNLEPRP